MRTMAHPTAPLFGSQGSLCATMGRCGLQPGWLRISLFLLLLLGMPWKTLGMPWKTSWHYLPPVRIGCKPPNKCTGRALIGTNFWAPRGVHLSGPLFSISLCFQWKKAGVHLLGPPFQRLGVRHLFGHCAPKGPRAFIWGGGFSLRVLLVDYRGRKIF